MMDANALQMVAPIVLSAVGWFLDWKVWRERKEKEADLARYREKPFRAEDTLEAIIARDIVHPNDYQIKLKDISGLDLVKEDLKKFVIDPLKGDDHVTSLYRTVLLTGPPGCGQTSLVKAAANEAKAALIRLRMVDVVDMKPENAESHVTAAFALVKNLETCVIHVDKVERFWGRKPPDKLEDQMAKMFMDRWLKSIGECFARAVVICEGHADLNPVEVPRGIIHYHVGLPNLETRQEIFRRSLQTVDLEPGFGFRDLSFMCKGLSGDSLVDLCTEMSRIHTVPLEVRHFCDELKLLKRSGLEQWAGITSRVFQYEDYHEHQQQLSPYHIALENSFFSENDTSSEFAL